MVVADVTERTKLALNLGPRHATDETMIKAGLIGCYLYIELLALAAQLQSPVAISTENRRPACTLP
jgi:hypothetical protein